MYMYSIHTACILVMFADASRARVQVGSTLMINCSPGSATHPARECKLGACRSAYGANRGGTHPARECKLGVPQAAVPIGHSSTHPARECKLGAIFFRVRHPLAPTHPARECKLGAGCNFLNFLQSTHPARECKLGDTTSRISLGSFGRIPRESASWESPHGNPVALMERRIPRESAS